MSKEQQTIRVTRIVTYTGPREAVEEQVAHSLHGSRVVYKGAKGQVKVEAVTIGLFPDVLADGSFELQTDQVDLSSFSEKQRLLAAKHGTPKEFECAVQKLVPYMISQDEANAAIVNYDNEWSEAEE